MNTAGLAPAKVNLFLHVGPKGADGYHPICSLMVFADFGDQLDVEEAERLELEVAGPFAIDAPNDSDNLVLKAVGALGEEPKVRIRLDKRIPAGAGLGGGSADAAAALRLLGAGGSKAELLQIASTLGADVPACLGSAPVLAEGRGEILGPPPSLPVLPAVLVRPPARCATAEVYRAYDSGEPKAANRPPDGAVETVEDAVAWLCNCRNDLEAPAIAVQPLAGEALRTLRAQPEVLLARITGSGSASFGLCVDMEAARAVAARLSVEYPDWWVKACLLGGPWPDPQ